MRILVVDDSPERMTNFRGCLSSHDVVYAMGCEEAEPHLSERFDLMFLDHDLGDSELTGVHLAKAIAASENAITPAILHSANSAGAREMQFYLRNSKIVPYPLLDIQAAVQRVEQLPVTEAT